MPLVMIKQSAPLRAQIQIQILYCIMCQGTWVQEIQCSPDPDEIDVVCIPGWCSGGVVFMIPLAPGKSGGIIILGAALHAGAIC